MNRGDTGERASPRWRREGLRRTKRRRTPGRDEDDADRRLVARCQWRLRAGRPRVLDARAGQALAAFAGLADLAFAASASTAGLALAAGGRRLPAGAARSVCDHRRYDRIAPPRGALAWLQGVDPARRGSAGRRRSWRRTTGRCRDSHDRTAPD